MSAMKSAIESTRVGSAEEPASLKIGEVSKLSGVGIEALRFYERSGVLGRPARTTSGYRMYTSEVLERLDFIKRAQVLGFSLDEIKQIIAEKRAGQSPCAEVREIVRARLQELDERLAQMKRYRKELAANLTKWDEAGDVEGHICGMIEGSHMKSDLSEPRRVRKRSSKKR